MTSKLIEHHTHYKEIDGYDETVWMTPSDHVKLHRRLREEGRCNISPQKLQKISCAAYGRKPEIKMKREEYRKEWERENEEKVIEQRKEYYKKNKIERDEKSKEYYENHKDSIIAYTKKWNDDNREKVLQYKKKWYRKKKLKEQRRNQNE